MTIIFEKLGVVLQNLLSSSNYIEAAAIVSPDGLPIVTRLPSGMYEEHISEMCAVVRSLGEQIGVELSRGTLKSFSVEGSNGSLILTSCGEDAVLLVLASKFAQLGQLLIEIKRTATKIKSVLISEDLKHFFGEDLVENLKDFLSEESSLQAALKNTEVQQVAQEAVVGGLITNGRPANIPAFNGKLIQSAENGHKQSGKEIASTQLLTSVSFALDQAIPEQQDNITEQVQLITEITRRIRQSLYLEDVLKTTVKEVRRVLKADRVYFYRFNSDWSGLVVAESVAPGWPSCLKIKAADTYFTESAGIEKYKNGRVCVNDDIYKAGLTDCHLKLLEQFAIKAQLVAPILKNNQLFALLVANQCSQTRTWEKDEIDLFVQLAKQVGSTLEQANLLEQQEAEVEQTQLLTEVTRRLHQSLSLEDLLKTTVKEVRRALKTERVVIYGLDPTDWDGIVVAESVAPGWPQILRLKIDDPCFKNRYVELYKNGQITTINDIYQDPRVTDCYRKMLQQFAVKANLVAPILKNNQLLGLMIAHHCSAPRNWQKHEVDLFAQLANYVGVALEQASLLEQQEAEAERAQLLIEITHRLHQSLSLEDLLKTTVKEVRRALKTDRVIIVDLNPTDWNGLVVAESVAPDWPQILRVKIDDPCFKERDLETYKNGHFCAVDNIYEEPGLTDAYIKVLEQFAIKANLVVPILKNNQLLGLIIAHHCSEPRNWQKPDINLLTQLVNSVGFAVNQASLIKQLEQEQAA